MTLIYKDREPKLMNKADSASTIIIIICTVGFLGPDQTTVEYKVEKLKYSTRSFRSCSQGSESNPNFHLVNKPTQISRHEDLQSWLVNTVYHSLVKNN